MCNKRPSEQKLWWSLINDHLWNLDEPDVMKLIENMIAYVLIRDEYRAIRKKEFKQSYTFFVGLMAEKPPHNQRWFSRTYDLL